ncbi:epoxide hydrolase 3-like [Toxorhynchites rutilus septentrionalis]|uniref:epoxide hydrolase 3-like n=1 Tax=Toxorhynchites rutilus septentrionalis TaxID=329112 RepID=UPI0024791124|nr:epoxide hydrolase 3-like [Toxorhynchites rutilus septentrionalis]
MASCAVATLQLVISWMLCLYYSAQIVLLIVFEFFTKPHSKFWVTKKRPYPPQCLQKHDYGTSKYITVNGVKLHYVENGDSSKPLMLLVHGFPEFWFSWRHQLNEFAKDYWVIAVDMRGYGDSDKPEGLEAYRIENMVQDIRELVITLGRKKFTLVAHDWGAVIGWEFVARHMDMLDKYIMMDAPSKQVIRKAIISSRTQFKMSWYTFFFQMPKLPEFFVRMNDIAMFDKVFRHHCNAEEVEAYKYTFAKKGALTPPINYYRANRAPRSSSVCPPADVSSVPGLYLLGELDMYISKETGSMMQKQFEKLEFRIVPGADHFLQQHKPVLVNQLMREFLEKK